MSSEDCDVMISLQVSTMGESAVKLKQFLASCGLNVWICTENLSGGDSYRDAIVGAVKSCKVFLPLINEEWALSGECKDEFNLAKRLNLTSHERGRTERSDFRLPIILPVAFSGLRWDAHSHVELLAANTNFIVHSKTNLMEGSVDPIFHAVVLSMVNYGIKLELPANLKDKGVVSKIAKDQVASSATASFGQQEDRIESAMNLVQSLSMALQELKTAQKTLELQAPKSSVPVPQASKVEKKDEPIVVLPKLPVGAKFFGTSSIKGEMNDGHTFEAWQSCELTVVSTGADNRVTCELLRTELRKVVDGSDKPDRNPPLPGYLKSYLSSLGASNLTISGPYDTVTGLLSLKEDSKLEITVPSAVVWQDQHYYLTAFNDFLAGPTFAVETLSDRKVTPGSLMLRRFV